MLTEVVYGYIRGTADLQGDRDAGYGTANAAAGYLRGGHRISHASDVASTALKICVARL
jgi:hypothetical protein